MSLQDIKVTGATRHSLKNVVVDAGAVYFVPIEGTIQDPDTWEIFGATQGGNSFNVEQEIREIEVDGIKGPVVDGKDIEFVTAQITANVVELSKEVLEHAFPGAEITDWPEDADESTHDHITRNRNIELADYIKHVVLVGRKRGGKEPIACYISNGLQEEAVEMALEDESEAVMELTFTGHFDPEEPEDEPWGILNPKAETYDVTFTVEDDTDVVEDATVELSYVGEKETDADGEAVFDEVWPGTYGYAVRADGYETESGEIEVEDDDVDETITLTSE